MALDLVTLVQLEGKGCVMVKATYAKDTEDRSASAQKTYTFKAEPHVVEGLRKGDWLVVNQSSGNSVVCYQGIDDNFEPLEGVTYCWVVMAITNEQMVRLREVDKQARRRMALGEAMQKARVAISEEDRMKMLPSFEPSIDDGTMT